MQIDQAFHCPHVFLSVGLVLVDMFSLIDPMR